VLGCAVYSRRRARGDAGPTGSRSSRSRRSVMKRCRRSKSKPGPIVLDRLRAGMDKLSASRPGPACRLRIHETRGVNDPEWRVRGLLRRRPRRRCAVVGVDRCHLSSNRHSGEDDSAAVVADGTVEGGCMCGKSAERRYRWPRGRGKRRAACALIRVHAPRAPRPRFTRRRVSPADPAAALERQRVLLALTQIARAPPPRIFLKGLATAGIGRNGVLPAT